MDNRNPYEVLGVPPSATESEIRAAYRALSLRYHPDRLNSAPLPARDDAAHMMRALNAAYAVLKDPRKRADLDQQLKRSRSIIVPPPAPPEEIVVDAAPAPPGVFVPHEPTRPTAATSPPPFAPQPEPPYPKRATYAPRAASATVFEPFGPQPAGAVPTPVPLIPQVDWVRVATFAMLTSLGWVAVSLVNMALPWPATVAAVVFYAGALAFLLAFLKPARARQPLTAPNLLLRGVLLALLTLLVLIAFVLSPRATAYFSAALQTVFQLVGLAFVLIVHWGVCLVSYLLI